MEGLPRLTLQATKSSGVLSLFSSRLLRRVCLFRRSVEFPAAAQSISPVPDSDFQTVPAFREYGTSKPAFLDRGIQELPMFRLFGVFDPLDALLSKPAALAPPPSPPPCPVTPLQQIDDPGAALLEESPQDNPRVDLTGLTPATSRALARFQRVVVSAGGDLWLTSAYRPPAYQQHLQSVWDKWAELRNNQQPECQPLKTAVAAEFAGHRLLPKQRPVSFSDHTRGTGFDAAVTLSAVARHRRRRFNIDRLARLAGVHRPDIARDPVDFRLIARSSRS